MKKVHRHITGFWSEERSLTAFLIILIVEIFVIAPMQFTGLAFKLLNSVLFSLLLVVGLLTLTQRKSIRVVLALFVVLSVVTHWANVVFGVPGLVLIDGFFMLSCSIALLVVVLRQVYRDGPVTSHRIMGAVAGYLLLTLIFAFAYKLIETFLPGSFQMPAIEAHAVEQQLQAFYYFSVITLTTTGYGDITAVNPFARTLVMMEALTGQLYTAILIARLVSLHAETKRK